MIYAWILSVIGLFVIEYFIYHFDNEVGNLFAVIFFPFVLTALFAYFSILFLRRRSFLMLTLGGVASFAIYVLHSHYAAYLNFDHFGYSHPANKPEAILYLRHFGDRIVVATLAASLLVFLFLRKK